MNINECMRDWLNENIEDHPVLENVDLLTSGEEGNEEPPFIGIYETDSSLYEQGGVVMYGVTEYQLMAELHTVPASEEEEGTPATEERKMRDAMYNILADRSAIGYMEDRHGWQVFDIRLSSPTTEPEEGRRISKLTMSVTACPTT